MHIPTWISKGGVQVHIVVNFKNKYLVQNREGRLYHALEVSVLQTIKILPNKELLEKPSYSPEITKQKQTKLSVI